MDKKEIVEWAIKEFASNQKFEDFVEFMCGA